MEKGSHGGGAHVVPLKVLFGVWLALVVLTAVTVGAVKVDLGSLNIWIALAIALVKASFVGLYFMHLRYDSPFNALVLVASLLFVVLFVGLALLDTAHYQPDLIPGYAPGVLQ
ncbi:MAG: cytochrome C oxidase subunit IV family protein [Candidatus Eisenbacteria bacterium]